MAKSSPYRNRWDMLLAIRRFMEDPSIDLNEQESFMRIACAWRGPDTESSDTKFAFTMPIRMWSLGQAAFRKCGMSAYHDSEAALNIRKMVPKHLMNVNGDHYYSHIKRAADALMLNLDEVISDEAEDQK